MPSPPIIIDVVPPPLNPALRALHQNSVVDKSSYDTETLDEFLDHFTFDRSTILPSGCQHLEQVLYGLEGDDQRAPRRLCLPSNSEISSSEISVYIDIDSVLWNLEFLPLSQPLFIFPDPPQARNITGSHQYVRCPGHEASVPLDNTPHCLFGEIGPFIKIHVVFPGLSPAYLPLNQDYLPSCLLDTWYDRVVYPALAKTIPEERLPHYSTSRVCFKMSHPGPHMGHILNPKYTMDVALAMRSIVEADEAHRLQFHMFFFHAACKGVKESMAVPLEDLQDPAKLDAWRDKATSQCCGIFG
ncbi:MAG: hypothetical protein DHS80DRAFT_24214, partial [Piptocephalis tieghemiana]